MRLRSLLLVCSLFLLAGCGSEVATIDHESVVTTKTEGTLPSDWPSDVPVAKGVIIPYAASVNPVTGTAEGQTVMYTTEDTPEAVVKQYRKDLEANGWKIIAATTMEGTSMVTASKDKRTVGISASGMNGMTAVTIGVATNGR
jgi:hypothetical protein